jgi:DNA-binding transcriptional LysR family regulator
LDDIDWEDFRIFLAAVRSGGFAKAAIDLSVGQATISRRIERMEKQFGVRLFERTPAGSKPSADAIRIIGLLRSAETAINRAAARIGSSSRRLEGEVRMLVTEGLAAYWLAPFFSAFRRAHPDVSLRVHTVPNSAFDRGKSYDIQIQFLEPQDPKRIGQHLGTLQFVPMASKAYLQKYGWPRTMGDLDGHQLYDHTAYVFDKGSWANWLDEAGKTDAPANSLVSNSTPVLAELVRQGHGIAILPSYAPLIDDRLTPLSLGIKFLTPFWMSVHADVAELPHVKAMAEVMRRAIDPKRMPWFSETFIFPTPELLETWRGQVLAETADIADAARAPQASAA